jgi:hypothetical protein
MYCGTEEDNKFHKLNMSKILQCYMNTSGANKQIKRPDARNQKQLNKFA